MKYTIIAILLGIVVVAAIAYIVGMSKKEVTTQTPTIGQQQAQTTPKTDKTKQPAANQTEPTGLAALKFPGKDATKDEYTAFNTKVYDMSVAADKVTLTNCVANPAVIRVAKGKEFTIHNADSKEHKITNLGSSTPITIAAGADAKVALKDVGVYGYGCDPGTDRTVPAGIVAVMDVK